MRKKYIKRRYYNGDIPIKNKYLKALLLRQLRSATNCKNRNSPNLYFKIPTVSLKMQKYHITTGFSPNLYFKIHTVSLKMQKYNITTE